MTHYPSTQVRPYVYICFNKETGEFYIGYREANTVPSHLDFLTYRTSSTVVKPSFEKYDWWIVAEFITGNDAYDFEQTLIFENWNNPLLLNENCRFNSKKRFKSNLKNKPKSAAHKANMVIAAKNRPPITDAHREKLSSAKKGKPPNNKGKPNKKRDATALHNMSLSKQGEKHPMWGKTHVSVSCIYCKQEMKITVFGKYHGTKCKSNS